MFFFIFGFEINPMWFENNQYFFQNIGLQILTQYVYKQPILGYSRAYLLKNNPMFVVCCF